MPKEKLKKRLLYDLSVLPQAPINEGVEGKFEPEVRVVFKDDVLLDSVVVKQSFKIGTSDNVDFVFDEDVFAENVYNLVSVSNQEVVVNLQSGFKGYYYNKTDRKDIETLVKSGTTSLKIDKDSFAVIVFGSISICVLQSKKEKLKPAGFIKNVDISLIAAMLIVFIIGFFVFNAVVETPPVEVDIMEIDNRFVKLIVASKDDVKVEEVKKEKKIKLKKPKEGLVQASQQRKSLGSEGRVGNKKSRVANAQGSARRGLDEKVANSSGIMGAMSAGAQSFDRVFGGGGLGAGMEKTLGSVTGISGVDQFGSGGLGTKGFGMGGGGNALGVGGLGSRGRGGGGGSRYGMAAGRIGGKGRSRINAGGGRAIIMGALDRSVIDAYIRRNLAKIRWCYEKELNRDPKIFGKIVINFIISGTGRVSTSKVKRTTMGNKNVESCVARQIRKIHFPKPKGGGIVIVNYPFVFKNSAG
jgi:hypothetical protein